MGSDTRVCLSDCNIKDFNLSTGQWIRPLTLHNKQINVSLCRPCVKLIKVRKNFRILGHKQVLDMQTQHVRCALLPSTVLTLYHQRPTLKRYPLTYS